MPDVEKEIEEQPKDKKVQDKSETKSSCDCGCTPPMKSK